MSEQQAFKEAMNQYFKMICEIIIHKNPTVKLTNDEQEFVRSKVRYHLDRFEKGEIITQFFKEKITDFTKLQLEQLQGKQGLEYLKQNIINWRDYKLFLGAFCPLVIYLDSFKLKGEKTSSHNIGYEHFKNNFQTDIADKLNNFLFQEMEKERKGFQILQETQTLIKEIISLYYQLDLKPVITLKEKSVSTRNKTWTTTEYEFETDPNSNAYTYESNPVNKNQASLQELQHKQHQYYIQNFETKMLNNLRQIYENKLKQEWMKPTPEYVILALTAIDTEENRAKKYYSYSIYQVEEILRIILIQQPAQQLVLHEVGVQNMLEKKKKDELIQIFQLFNKIPQLSPQQQEQLKQQQQQFPPHPLQYIAEVYQKYIKDRLNEIKKKQEEEQKQEEQKAQGQRDGQVQKKGPAIIAADFIQYVLDIKIESDNLISEVFGNQLMFKKARDNAFRAFLNEDQKYIKHFAFKCDMDFRKNIKEMNPQQIENLQNQIINLYNYLNCKDVFLNDYTKFFQTRNIRPNLSLNQEAEKQLITKLKTETGPTQNIIKLQKMINDLNDDAKNDFNQFQTSRKIDPNQFEYNYKFLLLTYGCWDVNLNYKLELPDTVQPLARQFEVYYKNKYPERTLVWIVNESTIEVFTKPNIFQKPYNFILTLEQYVLLNCIERNNNSVTVDELQQMTKIEEKSLYYQLACLCSSKFLTRSKPPQDRTQIDKFNDPTEIISINLKGFQSVNRLVNYSLIKPKLEGPVGGSVDQEITQQRYFQIDSTIVRIMKSRKQYHFEEIIDETVRMIELFRAQPRDIKKRLESLQERQYIQRDENDQKLYIYLP